MGDDPFVLTGRHPLAVGKITINIIDIKKNNGAGGQAAVRADGAPPSGGRRRRPSGPDPRLEKKGVL